MQVDRLVRSEHLSGGDAEGKGIADLAGGAGDRDVQGWLHDGAFSNERAGDFTAKEGYFGGSEGSEGRGCAGEAGKMARKRCISACACAASPSARSAAICRSQVLGSLGWGEAAALRLASAGWSRSGAPATLSVGGVAGIAADDAMPVEGDGAVAPAAEDD